MNADLNHFVEKQKEVIANSYEHSKQYANVIVIGGYAGIFAVWNFTKDDLERWQTLASGLCVLSSLLIYIIFELYSSWFRSSQMSRQLKQLEEAERLDRLPEKFGKAEQERAQQFIKIWPYFFFIAVSFALAGASILIYSFVSGLLCGAHI